MAAAGSRRSSATFSVSSSQPNGRSYNHALVSHSDSKLPFAVRSNQRKLLVFARIGGFSDPARRCPKYTAL